MIPKIDALSITKKWKEEPLVSIGLPVHNGEKHIGYAIESILAQTYRNIELIISDNASTDGTQLICKHYAKVDWRIKYYKNNENLGAIPNYNMVFYLTKGKYFKWAAHDDIIGKEFIEKCVEILEKNEDGVVCFSKISFIDDKGNKIRETDLDLNIVDEKISSRIKKLYCLQLNEKDIFWAIFGLIKKSILVDTGLFERFVAADQALLMKLLLQGKIYCLNEKLFSRRIHDNASTVKLPKSKNFSDRAKWYCAKKPVKIVLPNWNLLLSESFTVVNYKSDIGEKIRCLYWIFRMFLSRRIQLLKEVVTIPRQIFTNVVSILKK